MEIEIGEWIAQLQAGVAAIPPALIAVVLLAGPTVGWVVYRSVVQPRARQMVDPDVSAMWVCPSCRSVNELRMARCYRCDARPVESDLELIDADPSGRTRLTPVGPGLDLGGPRTRTTADARRYAASSVAEEVASLIERSPTPVGPGRPGRSGRLDVVRPRRAVGSGRSVVSGADQDQDPDGPSAA